MIPGPGEGGRPPLHAARVRVTRTRRRVTTGERTSLREEVDAQSTLGTTFVDSLRRAQGILALRVVVGLAVVLALIPLVWLLFPGLSEVTPLGIPLPWLVLGALLYPFILGLALWFTRASERLEADFTEVVDPR